MVPFGLLLPQAGGGVRTQHSGLSYDQWGLMNVDILELGLAMGIRTRGSGPQRSAFYWMASHPTLSLTRSLHAGGHLGI